MALNKAHIRVTMGTDGRTPDYELMVEGVKICELTFIEVLEFATQATSALRWYPRVEPKKSA